MCNKITFEMNSVNNIKVPVQNENNMQGTDFVPTRQ